MSNDDRYHDDHTGENPVTWPRQAIEDLDETWEADEIKQDIDDCRGCSYEYGLCDYHKGLIEGYDKGTHDMTRAFDITKEDVEQ